MSVAILTNTHVEMFASGSDGPSADTADRHASGDLTPYRHCYVHVPFCARRCSYCDFAISVRSKIPVADYVAGVELELLHRKFLDSSLMLDTVYLGGGTPSILGPDGVRDLLDVIKRVGIIGNRAEITLEANPENITPESVNAWRDAGINRLSIGIQSFDDGVLRWMHRVHDAAQAERAVQVARESGISAVSLDLIFSLPSELKRDWNRDLERAVALDPNHISLYGLTVEPSTPLGRWTAAGKVAEAPEELYEGQFLTAHSYLGQAGYEHYEVSNFAKPGQRAVHNSAYWRGVQYLGVGPSAHGFDGHSRRWNHASYVAWLRALTDGVDPVAGNETLTPAERVTESVYLGLRTKEGLAFSTNEYPLLSKWAEAGWLELSDSEGSPRARCTPEGWLRLDGLAADLTAFRSH